MAQSDYTNDCGKYKMLVLLWTLTAQGCSIGTILYTNNYHLCGIVCTQKKCILSE